MAKLQTTEIQIPFAGFYYSVYSDAIDHEAESYTENHCDESGGDESKWPKALRLSADQYSGFLFDVTDYRAAYERVAKDYLDAFSYAAGEALGISAMQSVRFYSWQEKKYKRERREVASLRLTWAAMESPREYNFSTDRIFANIPASIIRKLWTISKEDEHATLSHVAERRHTSRDGFISGYRNDWRQWGKLADWDHNQLMTLLIAACEARGFDWEDSDLAIYYATTEYSGPCRAWESAVDWKAFDAKRDEARAEKLAQWISADPDNAKAWIGQDERAQDLLSADIAWPEVDLSDVPYRCSLTPDLFDLVES